jgi:hypothetical protein
MCFLWGPPPVYSIYNEDLRQLRGKNEGVERWQSHGIEKKGIGLCNEDLTCKTGVATVLISFARIRLVKTEDTSVCKSEL